MRRRKNPYNPSRVNSNRCLTIPALLMRLWR